MSIFSRSNDINRNFTLLFQRAGYFSVIVNMITLLLYFWGRYSKAAILARVTGSVALSSLILGVEFATLSVLFDPTALDAFLAGLTDKSHPFSKFTTYAGIVTVGTLAGLTFYLDYTINLAQFQLDSVTFDYQLLATVLIFIAEIFFWISNICEASAKPKSTQSFK